MGMLLDHERVAHSGHGSPRRQFHRLILEILLVVPTRLEMDAGLLSGPPSRGYTCAQLRGWPGYYDRLPLSSGDVGGGRLQEYRKERRWRLTEMFFEVDKKRDGVLVMSELIRFVSQIVPDFNPGQLRRFHQYLDRDRCVPLSSTRRPHPVPSRSPWSTHAPERTPRVQPATRRATRRARWRCHAVLACVRVSPLQV